jgi:hypothetical protein
MMNCAMITYGGVDVKIHVFLTLALRRMRWARYVAHIEMRMFLFIYCLFYDLKIPKESN